MPQQTAKKVEILTMDDGTKLPNLEAAIERTGQVQALLPKSIDEAYRLAQAIVKSGLAPDSYKRNKGDREADVQMVHIGILKSMEVGIPPITGLGVIAIINNRPCIWGDGATALIQSKGVLANMTVEEIGTVPGENASDDKFTETHSFADDYGIEVKMWRKGQEAPYVGRFTVGDAKRAKLWMNPHKQPWMLYPRRMLKWRAFSWPARDGFADCLSGLQIREEVEDLPVPAPTVNTSFLDDAPQDEAPQDEAPPESDEPGAPPTDTAEPETPSEPEAEPRQETNQEQGDLLGAPPSAGQLVAAVGAALSNDDLTAYLKSMREQIDAMDMDDQVVINDAVEAQRVKLSEAAVPA